MRKIGVKRWVTKYALSKGLQLLRGDVVYNADGSRHYFSGKDVFLSERYFFETREDAVAAAEKMRDKKIASLKKQIAKLEKLDFSEPS